MASEPEYFPLYSLPRFAASCSAFPQHSSGHNTLPPFSLLFSFFFFSRLLNFWSPLTTFGNPFRHPPPTHTWNTLISSVWGSSEEPQSLTLVTPGSPVRREALTGPVTIEPAVAHTVDTAAHCGQKMGWGHSSQRWLLRTQEGSWSQAALPKLCTTRWRNLSERPSLDLGFISFLFELGFSVHEVDHSACANTVKKGNGSSSMVLFPTELLASPLDSPTAGLRVLV